MIYSTSFWNHFFLTGKPTDVPYFQLLSTRKTLDNHVKERYFMLDPVLIFISVILVALWLIFGDRFLYPAILGQELVLVGGLTLIAIIILANGLFFMYFYNWPYIKKLSATADSSNGYFHLINVM